MGLFWVISAGLYSAHSWTQLHRNNLAISKILNQNLRVGNDERISDVELVSVEGGVVVGHYGLGLVGSACSIANRLVIGMLGIVHEFPLCLRLLSMVRLIYHFDSLRALQRSIAHIVIFKPLLRHFLCLSLLFQRLRECDSLFEIIQRRVYIDGSIVHGFQLSLTGVLDRLIIHACVLPRLLPI